MNRESWWRVGHLLIRSCFTCLGNTRNAVDSGDLLISTPLKRWLSLTSSQLFPCENEGLVLLDHLIFREKVEILFLNVGSIFKKEKSAKCMGEQCALRLPSTQSPLVLDLLFVCSLCWKMSPSPGYCTKEILGKKAHNILKIERPPYSHLKANSCGL